MKIIIERYVFRALRWWFRDSEDRCKSRYAFGLTRERSRTGWSIRVRRRGGGLLSPRCPDRRNDGVKSRWTPWRARGRVPDLCPVTSRGAITVRTCGQGARAHARDTRPTYARGVPFRMIRRDDPSISDPKDLVGCTQDRLCDHRRLTFSLTSPLCLCFAQLVLYSSSSVATRKVSWIFFTFVPFEKKPKKKSFKVFNIYIYTRTIYTSPTIVLILVRTARVLSFRVCTVREIVISRERKDVRLTLGLGQMKSALFGALKKRLVI